MILERLKYLCVRFIGFRLFRCNILVMVLFKLQLIAGTLWMDSGIAMTTAAWTLSQRKKYAPEEPTSFSMKDAMRSLRGQLAALSEVESQMMKSLSCSLLFNSFIRC